MKKGSKRNKPISNENINKLVRDYRYREGYQMVKTILTKCSLCNDIPEKISIMRYKSIEMLIKEYNCLTVDDALKFGHVLDITNMFAICSKCYKKAYHYMIDGIKNKLIN